MSPRARVLIIETVVPDGPGPHLSKELDIAMMALPGGRDSGSGERHFFSDVKELVPVFLH